MEVVFGLSPWLIVPSFLLAAGLSYVFYFFRSNTADYLSKPLQILLFTARFVVIFIVLLLLLEPLIKTIKTKLDKPIVLVVLDESESMAMAKDSLEVKNELPKAIQTLREELADDYEIKEASFGANYQSKIDFSFNQQASDFGNAVSILGSNYSNANLGAVIFISDGIQNRGENPLPLINQIRSPWYTVATGDTISKIDAAVTNVMVNKTVFKGNAFPVLVSIKATKLMGNSGVIELVQSGKVVGSQLFKVPSGNFAKDFNFILKADKPGFQQYTARVTVFDKEVNTVNNRTEFFIDVIEDKEKIALFYSKVHPDVAAIARSLENIENYEVTVKEAGTYTQGLTGFGALIYHQTGAVDAAQKALINNAIATGLPIWFILGPNSDWNFINQLGIGVRLTGAQGLNQVQGRLNDSFQLFNPEVYSSTELQDLPPLSVPFGELAVANGIQTLYFQQLDRLSTTTPLLAFSQNQGKRFGFLLGEGIWRWRLADYQQHQNHLLFDKLLARSIQYLTANSNKKQLQVNASKIYDEGSSFAITADLFDDAGQFVTGQEIKLELTQDDSISYSYTFSPGTYQYQSDINGLPAGKYRYQASCIYNGKKLNASGSFLVQKLQLEASNLTADHQLLYQMASTTGGVMLSINQLKDLPGILKKNEVIKPVMYSSSTIDDGVKIKWICFLLIGLLAIEWFVRKRNGLR